MPETKENKFGAAFHSHLDACAQCREHPFDLCHTGSVLLRSSVTEETVRVRSVHGCARCGRPTVDDYCSECVGPMGRGKFR